MPKGWDSAQPSRFPILMFGSSLFMVPKPAATPAENASRVVEDSFAGLAALDSAAPRRQMR